MLSAGPECRRRVEPGDGLRAAAGAASRRAAIRDPDATRNASRTRAGILAPGSAVKGAAIMRLPEWSFSR